ncbi:MAG: metallophosphoesterase [Lachnospiraceae bacterium]|nr:metallophosphoesterase [Lachnospiraceae bacterium]
MKYYITGDCHGAFGRIQHFCKYNLPPEPCTIVLLGDVGLNIWLDKNDKKSKKILSRCPVTFLSIYGNHEKRPSEIDTYKEREWNGGIVYYEEEYPNLLFAKDGEIYMLGDKKAIAIGGAYSVDKEERLAMWMAWFESEQPSDEIKAYVESQLEKNDWKVDYVLSHTAPLKYEPVDLFLSCVDQSKVDKSTEEWLSSIESKLAYDRWWFGHYHGNRVYDKATMLFEEIWDLDEKTCVQKIGLPKYKVKDMVTFAFDNGDGLVEKSGVIKLVDIYGSDEQTREATYDIEAEDKALYKHISESDIIERTME